VPPDVLCAFPLPVHLPRRSRSTSGLVWASRVELRPGCWDSATCENAGPSGSRLNARDGPPVDTAPWDRTACGGGGCWT
jgi:hypothetical protein